MPDLKRSFDAGQIVSHAFKRSSRAAHEESPNMTHKPTVAIIGAGPAGLTAAYLLAKNNVPVTVLEADSEYVGGISRTAKYKGFHFDIGGHRFFSKSKDVEDFWTEILPDDLLDRPRSSRIFYRGRFFAYPLKAGEALMKLGIFEATRCMLSYFKAHWFPIKNPRSFEDWVTNQFGARLFNIFFKTYTEKVWGMSCKEISADWAAQRIKGLSLKTAVLNALLPKKHATPRGAVIKTLIDTFRYPRKGPGMMWEACAAKVKAMGGDVELGQKVVGCDFDRDSKLWTVTHLDVEGNPHRTISQHVISSAPMRSLINGITPPMSEEARRAGNSLKYRDFLTVMLILNDRQRFNDNWIYIHDPSVKVGRVQNFKSWSPEMVPDPEMCCYGLEYFCFEGDGVWSSPDTDLIELAKQELAKIGLAEPGDVVDGCVVRQPKAYPVYDDDYAKNVATVSKELEESYPNLHLVGRNGMHKYNNQDHAMMTAMLCVKNILAGKKVYDLWQVNQDAEYHEAGDAGQQKEIAASGLRMVPARVGPEEAPAAAS
jgi:protoporphyrinogen oxidase